MAIPGRSRQKFIIYGLIAIGFAGLIGAHEVAPATASPDDAATAPFVLSAVGTLAFIVAGVMAFRLLRRGG